MRQSPFLQKVSDEMVRRRDAKRTIQTYIHWIRRFILFHQKRYPEAMGEAEVEVGQLFSAINADYYLPAALMYGSGLWLMSAVRSPFSRLGTPG